MLSWLLRPYKIWPLPASPGSSHTSLSPDPTLYSHCHLSILCHTGFFLPPRAFAFGSLCLECSLWLTLCLAGPFHLQTLSIIECLLHHGEALWYLWVPIIFLTLYHLLLELFKISNYIFVYLLIFCHPLLPLSPPFSLASSYFLVLSQARILSSLVPSIPHPWAQLLVYDDESTYTCWMNE